MCLLLIENLFFTVDANVSNFSRISMSGFTRFPNFPVRLSSSFSDDLM